MSKRRQIFRQAALDRLASPDQLDRPIRVVGGIGWSALFFFLLILGFFLFWVSTATAPVKVKASGIIISSGGLNQIISNTQGRLKTLDIKTGDVLAVGDVVASFEQRELIRDLETSKAGLVDSQQRYEQLSAFYKANNRRELTLDKDRIKNIKQTRKRLNKRLALLSKKQKNIQQLFKRKIITEDVLIKVQLDLSDLRERLAELDNEEKTIAIRKQERTSKQEITLLDEQLKINQHQRKLQRIKAHLGEKLSLTSVHTGRVVEVMVNPGDVVEPGKALAIIAPLDSSEQPITAFMYVNPADGKRIRTGMQVQINPAAFRPEEFGYMLGKVKSVSELPATLEGMSRVLKNEQLARDLIKNGVPFEVRVELLADKNTPSGFQWSSSRGPEAEINAGMLLNAQVIVKRMRLINFLIPQFDRLLAMVKG